MQTDWEIFLELHCWLSALSSSAQDRAMRSSSRVQFPSVHLWDLHEKHLHKKYFHNYKVCKCSMYYIRIFYTPVRLAIAATRWKASDRSNTFAALLPDAKARGDHDCLCLLLQKIYFLLNWSISQLLYVFVLIFTQVC